MKFGVRSAAPHASAAAELPKLKEKTISLTNPAIRLKKMPAPTNQAERAPGPPPGGEGASVASLTLRRRGLLGPALEKQPIEELPLVVQTLDLARETLDLPF